MTQSITSILTEFGTIAWSHYNAPDALAPLTIPLLLWTWAYAYARYSKFSFHQWQTLHNVHNIGAIVFAGLSLYFQNDSIWNERIGILWSIGYFVIDIMDCTVRRDGPYLLHGLLCFGLGMANYSNPLCRHLRTNSKAALCELSNPFMHYAKRTRQPLPFLLFVLVYTACRIVWIPVMMQQCRNAGMEWTHPILLAVVGFYGLNWYWYIKMGKILIEGLFLKKEESTDSHDRKKQAVDSKKDT